MSSDLDNQQLLTILNEHINRTKVSQHDIFQDIFQYKYDKKEFITDNTQGKSPTNTVSFTALIDKIVKLPNYQ